MMVSACSSSPISEPQLTPVDTPTTDQETGQQTLSPESNSSTPSPTVRTVYYGKVQEVDVSYFSSGHGGPALKYVNNGTTGECFAYNAAVTCIGTPDSSVPDVEVGQWVNFGTISCTKPDSEVLVCNLRFRRVRDCRAGAQDRDRGTGPHRRVTSRIGSG